MRFLSTICLAIPLVALISAFPAPPSAGGRLARRDTTYPVSNPTDDCFDYEVLDNRGQSDNIYQPYDLYPTVQGIIQGVPNGNYWENP